MRDSDTLILENIYSKILEDFDWDTFKWEELKHKYSETCNEERRLDFYNKSGAVGFIIWEIDGGEVSRIYVGDKLRRHGIGTYIWETATEMSEENGWDVPEHSSSRTEEGDAFARSIGGYIPRLVDDVYGWSSGR